MNKVNDFSAIREGFFEERKWSKKQCPSCKNDYYSKKEIQSCGSYECIGSYGFLENPAPKSLLNIGNYLSLFGKFFGALGYIKRNPIEIFRREERTLFASAAGQVYDDFIYGRELIADVAKCIVVQPVIRLQGIEEIGRLDGISTSFIQTTTESLGCIVEDHLKALDLWLDFFSSLGLHVGSISIQAKKAENDWGGSIVMSDMLKFFVGGLEIGVANFFSEVPSVGQKTTLSDIGVGAERLIWAVNKSLSYFDCIGPILYQCMFERELLDSIRTSVLMIASGITPAHKNHGSKLRKILNKRVSVFRNFDLYDMVSYYYDAWASLISLPVSKEGVHGILSAELSRNFNLMINRDLKTKELFDCSHEEFLRSLIKKHKCSLGRLREVLKKKRKLYE